MDILLSITELLLEHSFPIWVIASIVVLLVIGMILYRSYGKKYFADLRNTRNIPYICIWLLAVIVFCVAYGTGLYRGIPVVLCLLVLFFIIADAMLILLTVYSPVGPVKKYLDKLEGKLYVSLDEERSRQIEKCPLYFRVFADTGEQIAYDLTKSKFLIETGKHTDAIALLKKNMSLNLLEDEKHELYIQLVYCYVKSGDSLAADEYIAPLKEIDLIAGLYFESCILFGKGEIEAAYVTAHKAESQMPHAYSELRVIAPLYINLARLQECRGNLSELFRYLSMAREKSRGTKRHQDIMSIDAIYLIKIAQYKLQTEEFETIFNEYMELANQAENTRLNAMNLQLALSRFSNDKSFVYHTMVDNYHKLHERASLDNQCMLEASVSNMFYHNGFSFDEIEDDMIEHFDHYIELPMPSRFNALSLVRLPTPPTGKLQQYYEPWSIRLENYATNGLIIDLEQYERTLDTLDYAERKWVIEQKIGFEIRSKMFFDCQKVSALADDMVAIGRDSSQKGLLLEAILYRCFVYDEITKRGYAEMQTIADQMIRLLTEAVGILQKLSEPDCVNQWAKVCRYFYQCGKRADAFEIAQLLIKKYPYTLFDAQEWQCLQWINEQSCNLKDEL